MKWEGIDINVGDWIWVKDTSLRGGITKIIRISKHDNGEYDLILGNKKINEGDWRLYKCDINKNFFIAKTKKELIAKMVAGKL